LPTEARSNPGAVRLAVILQRHGGADPHVGQRVHLPALRKVRAIEGEGKPLGRRSLHLHHQVVVASPISGQIRIELLQCPFVLGLGALEDHTLSIGTGGLLRVENIPSPASRIVVRGRIRASIVLE